MAMRMCADCRVLEEDGIMVRIKAIWQNMRVIKICLNFGKSQGLTALIY